MKLRDPSSFRVSELIHSPSNGSNHSSQHSPDYLCHAVNGRLNGSRPWQGTLRSTGQRILIGNTEGQTASLFGILDDLRIYNRALTEAEVLHLYEWSSSRAAWISLNSSGKLQLLLQPGVRYQLESSTDLRTWQPQGADFIAQEELTTLNLPIPSTNEFFRVRSMQ